MKVRFKYDDSLDVFGVHGVGGIIGTLMAGVFATASVSATATEAGVSGLLEGAPRQLAIQAAGVAIVAIWCLIGTWISLKLVDLLVGLRTDTDDERMGLDLALHGEALHQ